MQSQKGVLIRVICALVAAYFAFRYYDKFQSARGLPIKIVNLYDRGMGVVSTRAIDQGEMIIKEEPLFLIHAGSFDDLALHLRTVLSSLNSISRSEFSALSHPLKLGDPDIPLAIFKTNSIQISNDSAGIFPLTARINHGCSKAINSVRGWRKEGVLTVQALKPIKKGEEILTAYIDTKQPRSKRQADLLETYGFGCSCSVCSLPPRDSRRSDARLSSMATLKAEFAKWDTGEIDGMVAVRVAKRIWALGEEEGYWSGRGQLAEDVMKIAAAHEDGKAVGEWAGLAHEWYTIELGHDSEEAQRVRVLSSDPSLHGVWATRDELRVEGVDILL